MHIKKYMHHIIENGSTEDMYVLEDMLIDLIYSMKDTNSGWYKNMVFKLHKMAIGDTIGEHFAKKWVCRMKNEDGTTGGHWTFEETEAVKNQYGIKYDCWEFYSVMNMAYSDFYKKGADISYYVDIAKGWLGDVDSTPCKTLRYYLYIVE